MLSEMERILTITREEDALWVSQAAAEMARDAGFDGAALWEIGISASELATNIARHGGSGTLTIRVIDTPEAGLELLADDAGPGFTDIAAALRDGVSDGRVLAEEVAPSARRGLGSGLGAIARLTDDLTVENKVPHGARVRAVKWRGSKTPVRQGSASMRTLVLGIGNTLLSDDGVGIYAARAAGTLLDHAEADIREAEMGGFALLDLVEGYERVVVVDAVQCQHCVPGDVMIIREESLAPSLHLTAGHQVDLPTALELGRRLHRPVPETVIVVGIQAAEVTTFGEQCTPDVAAAIPVAARIIAGLVRSS